MWQIVMIAGPVIGGYLARVGGTRLPLAITAASFALITATVASVVPETLAPKDRVPFVFSLGQSSPLGALRLFRNGPGLLCATLMQTVDFWGDDSSLWDVQTVHQVGITGWDTARRGYFESATSLLNLPSYALGACTRMHVQTASQRERNLTDRQRVLCAADSLCCSVAD
jgi:hypothetical protein|eukprot:COSAG06_NODE_5734_length_3301_cov_2.318551_2_plen_170_part_00